MSDPDFFSPENTVLWDRLAEPGVLLAAADKLATRAEGTLEVLRLLSDNVIPNLDPATLLATVSALAGKPIDPADLAQAMTAIVGSVAVEMGIAEVDLRAPTGATIQ